MIDLFIGSHESTLEVNFKCALELCIICGIMHGLKVQSQCLQLRCCPGYLSGFRKMVQLKDLRSILGNIHEPMRPGKNE